MTTTSFGYLSSTTKENVNINSPVIKISAKIQ
jgi:hypothetical protein